MDPDTKFLDFIEKWAGEQGCRFIVENYDGRESDSLIDGMAVDDVWGWLLQEGEKKTDANFGCLEWKLVDDRLVLEWNQYGPIEL